MAGMASTGFVLLSLAMVPAAACGDGGGGGDSDGDAGGSGSDANGQPDGGGAGQGLCSAGDAVCLDHVTRRFCGATPVGLRWQDETCAAGAGCLAGQCVTGECADACNLGDTNAGKICELYDVTTGNWVTPAPAGSMHDRARGYQRWLRRDNMASGGVGDAWYSDPPTYANLVSIRGIGDSAIWTGTYLAAEALRLKVTGAADARTKVIATVDEPIRALIREDVVELVTELMRERTVPTTLIWNGTPLGTYDINMRFVVLAPDEMVDGAIELRVDSGNYDNSSMAGFQEFMPNPAYMVRQFPAMGWVPDIPRAGSAIMLASFFRVALRVTEGVPGYEDERAAILDYYENNPGEGGNIDDWLAIATGWAYLGDCGDSYFANNIVMEPMYNLARLEDDSARRSIVHDDILAAAMWPGFVNTKNSFFSFIYAGNVATADPSVATSAVEQLSGYPPAPRVRRGRADGRARPRVAAVARARAGLTASRRPPA